MSRRVPEANLDQPRTALAPVPLLVWNLILYLEGMSGSTAHPKDHLNAQALPRRQRWDTVESVGAVHVRLALGVFRPKLYLRATQQSSYHRIQSTSIRWRNHH